MQSTAFLEAARRNPQHFTRHRDLTFPCLIAFLLSGVRGAVQAELDAFFALLERRTRLCRVVTASAFSKARSRLWANVFDPLNDELLRLIDECIPAQPLWLGLRVLAADASKVRLTLLDRAGKRCIREGTLFGLFRPGIELFDSLILHSPLVGERQMLFERLDRLGDQDMLVLDRGYPGAWLVAALLHRGIPFCMRCDSSSTFAAITQFMRSGQDEAVVTLPPPNRQDAVDYECPRQASTVRLIRQVTPAGKVRVLMTSLLDAASYPATAFTDLYHRRWRIEEAFKRLKHRLSLEHTSGLTWLAACQDIGAKMVCDNLNALATYLATEQHIAPDSPWRVNRTIAFTHLRRLLPRVLAGVVRMSARIATELFAEITKNLQKFIPGRSRPRPSRPKPHKSHAYKTNA
ncbi:MAG: IS4 family transposase [Betaproteobacteria bacterium]|nr:IS4 family transposase [Betaproteobacteria bacterium]